MGLQTLAEVASHAIEIKHSRFLAQAAPVTSVDAAQAWLRSAGDPEATHNCWAWRIGGDYRSSDDGEPAGTAGRPILAAIDGQGFDRIVVVVTRWYGGIKLGAGGLVRAYGGAAAECLRLAERVPIVTMIDVQITFPFPETGAVHALLAVPDIARLGESFTASGSLVHVRLPAGQLEALRQRLRDVTRDRAVLTCLQPVPPAPVSAGK